MATEDIEVTSLSQLQKDTKGSVIIRFKRKRHAPPLESFSFIQNSESNCDTPLDPSILSDNVFTLAKTVELTQNSDYSQFVKEAKDESLIPEQIKRLKLNSTSSLIDKNNCLSPVLLNPIINSNADPANPGTHYICTDICKSLNRIENPAMHSDMLANITLPQALITDFASGFALPPPIIRPIKIFDIICDSSSKLSLSSDASTTMMSDDPPITCNGQMMNREDVSLPSSLLQREAAHYVYDLYYAEDIDLSLFDEPLGLRVNPLEYDITTITDPPLGCNKYTHRYGLDDSDDSNDEHNWRNDYPDEPDSTSDEEPDIDRMYKQKYCYEDDYYEYNNSAQYQNINDYDPGDDDDF